MQHRPASKIRRKLTRALGLSLGLLLLVSCLSLLLLSQFMDQPRYQEQVINVAGRQRMLSQRISKLALWLSNHPQDFKAKVAIQANIAQWRGAQASLLFGDQTLRIGLATDTELHAVLQRGNREMGELERIVNRISAPETTSEQRRDYTYRLLRQDEACLATAEQAVVRLEYLTHSTYRTLTLLQYASIAANLLFLLGTGVLICWPAVRSSTDLVERLTLAYQRKSRQLRRLRRAHRQQDITLDKLLDSEERYRLLVENSVDFIYEVTFSGQFLYASQSLLTRLGILKTEFSTLSYMSLIRQDFRQPLNDYYKKASQDKIETTYYEFPIIARSGEEIWLGQTGTAVYDEHGRVVRFQFIARDLTAFRKLNLETERHQRMLTAVLQSAKDGITTLRPIKDIAGDIVSLQWMMSNPAANNLFRVETLVGKTLLDVLSVEEGSKLNEWCLDGLGVRFAREREVQLTLNGQPRWLRVSTVAMVEGIMLTLNDITAEKQAGQELQDQKNFYETILNHLPSEVVVFSPDHKYVFLNPNCVKSQDLREWLIGRTDYEYATLRNISNERADRRSKLFKQAVETRQPVIWEDFFDTPQGRVAHLRNFYPIFDPVTDELMMVLGQGMDISDIKKVEADLENARAAAEQAAIARQTFINSMSHEMRTPLNCVIGMSHLLLEDNPRPDQAEDLRAMLFSAKNLLALINDVLDFGKLEAGKVGLEHIPFHLGDILEGVLSTFRIEAKQKNIDLRMDRPASLPVHLEGDPVRLTQILTNLVSNAIKFTQSGGVLVQISHVSTTDGRVRLGFAIEDTGIGISPDKQAGIFESFIQAEQDTTRLYGGTGLGLSITKRLLGLFNADIHLHSELGKGSRFTFELEFPEVRPATATIKRPNVDTYSGLSGMEVLLVEDNEINRLIASKFLKRWGIVPTVAVNGLEAVEAVRSRTFDLVLMDIQMPVMDGYTSARLIRAIPNAGADQLPIVALTASLSEEVDLQVRQAGMNLTMSKPINPDELHELLLSLTSPIA